jgi:hypothetical protein
VSLTAPAPREPRQAANAQAGNSFAETGVTAERRDDVASTIALTAGNWTEPNGYRQARGYLFRMNIDLSMKQN